MNDTMLLALAFRGERPVGYGLAFDVSSHPFNPDWLRSGYITNLYVEAAERGRGAGQALFDYTLEWFASRGLAQVLLNVDPDSEQANHFWRKQGFRPYLLRLKRQVVEDTGSQILNEKFVLPNSEVLR